MCSPASDLPAGHQARPTVGRALVLMGVTVVVFTVFTVLTTQVRAVRSGSPWQDDPYDAVVTFTELFVPALAVLGVARALLWRREEPLPVVRVDQLLRAAKATSLLIGLTVVTDVVALALRADHRLWNRSTPVSITGLALVAVALCVSAVAVWRSHHALRRLVRVADVRGDWLADLPLLAARLTASWPPRHRGRVRVLTDRIVRWPALPGHLPGATGGVALLLAGAALSGTQVLQEGRPVVLFVFGTLLFAGSSYAGLAVVNGYLHLVAVPLPATRAGKEARASFVLGCLALPVVVGFRDLIWEALGRGHQGQTPEQLCLLTFGSGAVVACTAFVALRAASAARPERGGDLDS